MTINGNNFQANYEGGDGNDLTLTVVSWMARRTLPKLRCLTVLKKPLQP